MAKLMDYERFLADIAKYVGHLNEDQLAKLAAAISTAESAILAQMAAKYPQAKL